MGSIKEALRQDFAKAAEEFVQQLQRIEQAIGTLRGALNVRSHSGTGEGQTHPKFVGPKADSTTALRLHPISPQCTHH